MFQKLLSALGLAPKNLDEARSTYGEARTTLDSVNALFTAAGLNLETMLASGPDSLKAHLEGIDNTEELSAALAEVEDYDTRLAASQTEVSTLSSQLSALNSVAAEIGLSTGTPPTDAEIKTAFTAHIAKATTLALAKTGHPPAHVPAADTTPAGATATDAQLAADYAKLTGPARLDFYGKHEQALWRAARATTAAA